MRLLKQICHLYQMWKKSSFSSKKTNFIFKNPTICTNLRTFYFNRIIRQFFSIIWWWKFFRAAGHSEFWHFQLASKREGKSFALCRRFSYIVPVYNQIIIFGSFFVGSVLKYRSSATFDFYWKNHHEKLEANKACIFLKHIQSFLKAFDKSESNFLCMDCPSSSLIFEEVLNCQIARIFSKAWMEYSNLQSLEFVQLLSEAYHLH